MKLIIIFSLFVFYSVSLIIGFKKHINYTSYSNLPWIERGRLVVKDLQNLATSEQKRLISYLKFNNISFHSYWISNSIYLNSVNKDALLFMTKLDEIESIRYDKIISYLPYIDHGIIPKNDIKEVEWNVAWVNAPNAWTKGFTGSNITVAELDTGCYIQHPDIIKKYRGYISPGKILHDYNWFDGVITKNCQAEPCDTHGHGTHVMGTILGGDSTIGVAPNAKFISCRSFAEGGAGFEDIMNCFQFFISPTKTDGTMPNPDKRPHIINHSWGSKSNVYEFQEAIRSLHASGVLNVIASGNSGLLLFIM